MFVLLIILLVKVWKKNIPLFEPLFSCNGNWLGEIHAGTRTTSHVYYELRTVSGTFLWRLSYLPMSMPVIPESCNILLQSDGRVLWFQITAFFFDFVLLMFFRYRKTALIKKIVVCVTDLHASWTTYDLQHRSSVTCWVIRQWISSLFPSIPTRFVSVPNPSYPQIYCCTCQPASSVSYLYDPLFPDLLFTNAYRVWLKKHPLKISLFSE